MFKVGDKVKRVQPSDTPKFWGVVGEVYTVLSVLSNTGEIQVIDEKLTGFDKKTADSKAFELVVDYEDSWILNDGKTTIPDDAKTLKDTTGDIVAYKLVKKPKVEEHISWTSNNPKYDGTCVYPNDRFKHKVIFTMTEGILTDVRLEK